MNYREYEMKLYTQVSYFQSLLSYEGYGVGPWKDALQRMARTLENRRFLVAVVGSFNRGKSCFVNALLGRPVLPVDCLPTTATLSRITYGDRPQASLCFFDGREEPVEIEYLAEYITKLTKESAQQTREIKEAVVAYPTLLCNSGIDILDTPGLNDETDMDAITLTHMQDIDLAIVLVTAESPFDMIERDFTLKLLENSQICQIIFVISKIDCVRPKEREKLLHYLPQRIKEAVWERLLEVHGEDSPEAERYRQIFTELPVFPVSSLDALDALGCNDMELYEKSGFAELNRQLPALLLRSQNRNLFLNSANKLIRISQKNRQWIQERANQRPAWEKHYAALRQCFRMLCEQGIDDWDYEEDIVSALPDVQREWDACRNQFAALEGAFDKGPSAIQETVSGMIKALQSQWNEQFRQREMEQIENRAAARRDALCEKLRSLLAQSHAMLLEDMEQPLVEFQAAFALPQLQAQPFQWHFDPQIPITTLQDLLNHLSSAVQGSLEYYGKQRRAALVPMLREAKSHLKEATFKLLSTLDGTTQTITEKLCLNQTSPWLLDQLKALEDQTSELKGRYLQVLADG